MAEDQEGAGKFTDRRNLRLQEYLGRALYDLRDQ